LKDRIQDAQRALPSAFWGQLAELDQQVHDFLDFYVVGP
jgi:hypothetical protein